MGPNALFSFDQFSNMTIFYPLIKFRRLPCSSSTGINNRAAGRPRHFGRGRRTDVMVFASPSGQFYRDVTNPANLPGLSHLDNFIVTHKSCPLIGTTTSGQLHHDTKRSSTYRDFAKTSAYRQVGMPTLTRTATQLNRRAVRYHISD
jgi:hypothetical protein